MRTDQDPLPSPSSAPSDGKSSALCWLVRGAPAAIALSGLLWMIVVIMSEGASDRLTVALIVFVSGCIGCAWAEAGYRRSRFAHAHTSEGTILVVDEIAAGDREKSNSVVFMVEADLADGVTLRRRVVVHDWPDPESWTGRRIRFRHRTLEPELLGDAYVGEEERPLTLYENPGAEN